MRRIVTLAGAIALLSSFAITPALAHNPAGHAHAKVIRVGLVTDVGGLNDKSFNHLAFVGFQQAVAKYGVKGGVIESHSEADYVPNLTNFASKGYDLTVAVGFLMASAVYTVATQYPNRKFALIDSAPANAAGNNVNLPNVANLFFKEQESGYLVGVIAGLMEKTKVGAAKHNTVGTMGGLSIPPVNRYIAGYFAGVHRVDKSARILLAYSQSFTDQGKGKQIGLQQISQGADILFQVAGASGLGYLAAAQQQGRYGIGVDADQGFLGKYVITSALKRVNVAVRDTIHSVQLGTFHGGDHLFTLKNNGTGFAKPSSVVPPGIVQIANGYKKLIKNGHITPPAVIP